MSSDRERVASCACGSLRVTVRGEPDLVVGCHCNACQKRTGSPFGVGAYYPREAVRTIEGRTNTYRRMAEDSDRSLTNHFCVDCGTTVYWMLDLRPNHVGVAIGCFGDPQFGRPGRFVWTQHKHEWVTLPSDLPAFPKTAS